MLQYSNEHVRYSICVIMLQYSNDHMIMLQYNVIMFQYSSDRFSAATGRYLHCGGRWYQMDSVPAEPGAGGRISATNRIGVSVPLQC